MTDVYTHTERDAAAYERRYGDRYQDQPTQAELAEHDAELRAERLAAARAARKETAT